MSRRSKKRSRRRGSRKRDVAARSSSRGRVRWAMAAGVTLALVGGWIAVRFRMSRPEGAPANTTGASDDDMADVRVPDPAVEGMQIKVRELMKQTRAAVLENPASGAAWAQLGAVCDAHALLDCATRCYRRARALEPNRFSYVYLLASVLQRTGEDDEESISLFQAAARLRDDYAPVPWRLGVVLERQGRLEEAREAYLHAIELDPDLAMGHRYVGQVLLALDDAAGALRHLKRAAELAPLDGAVYAAQAQAFRRLGQPEKAKQAADRSRSLTPVYDIPDPLRHAIRAKAVDYATLFSRAKRLVGRRRYAEAIPDLETCVAADPNDPTLQVFLATCYRATSQFDRARVHADKALQLDASNLTAEIELAFVSIKEGKLQEGLEHYRRAQQLRPTYGRTDAWIGDFLVREGYLQEGIAAFEHAETLGRMTGHDHWAWGLALGDSGDLDGAIRHFEKAIRLDPESANAFFSLGMAYEQDGRFEEAIDAYRRAVELDPKHPAAERLAGLKQVAP